MNLDKNYHFDKVRLQFRFWDTEEQKMVYVKANELEKLERQKNIMQCTGLVSSDGKLIYEGDIVRFYDPLENEDSNRLDFALIHWNDDGAGFELIKLDENLEINSLNIQSQGIRGSAETTILGNIFEGIFEKPEDRIDLEF